jgi:Immunoglobulin I-set domain/Immunoglobulin domain
VKGTLSLGLLLLFPIARCARADIQYSAVLYGVVGQTLASNATVRAASAPDGTSPMILTADMALDVAAPATAVLFGPAGDALAANAPIETVALGSGATAFGLCKTAVTIPYNSQGTYITLITPTQPNFSNLGGAWFYDLTSASSTAGQIFIYGVGGNPVQNHITNANGNVDFWETTVMVQTFSGQPLVCNAGDLIQVSSKSPPVCSSDGSLSANTTVSPNTPVTIPLGPSSWTLGNQIVRIQSKVYILCLPRAAKSGTCTAAFLTCRPCVPAINDTICNLVGLTSLRVSDVVSCTTNSGFYETRIQLTNPGPATISWAAGDLCKDGCGDLSYLPGAVLAAAASVGQCTYSTVLLSTDWPAELGNCIVQVAGNTKTACYVLTTSTTTLSPALTAQPTNLLVLSGSEAAFGVSLSGAAPCGCQWQFNGTNLLNATNALFQMASVGTNNAGNYAVVVANAAGSVTSSNATLTVVLSPQSRNDYASSLATFTAMAFGPEPLSYQWQKNGVNLAEGARVSGTTNSTLTIAGVLDEDAADYRAVATGASGSVTTSNAVLTVNDSLFIATQPQSQTVAVGSNATFSTTVYGAPPFVFQWYFNGARLGLPLTGTNVSVCTLTNVGAGQAGSYTVEAYNGDGSLLSSNAVLTVIAIAPAIETQPEARKVMMGSTTSFSVSVSGTPPLHYQWRWNGTDLPNATNATYLIQWVAATNAGSYSVVVTNGAGSVTSSNALLAVIVPPKLALQVWAGYPVLSLEGMLSSNFVVQYTTNVAGTNWMNLRSLPNLQTSPYLFLDPGAAGQPRFYRSLMQ